jgi:hypothetical protein
VVGGEVSRRGVREKGGVERVGLEEDRRTVRELVLRKTGGRLRGVGLEEDRRTVRQLVLRKTGGRFETVLRETIARFEWKEGGLATTIP